MLIGTNINIQGMSCRGCSAAIKLALEDTKGVNRAEVDLERGKANVLYEANLTSPEKLCGLINRLGYRAAVAEG